MVFSSFISVKLIVKPIITHKYAFVKPIFNFFWNFYKTKWKKGSVDAVMHQKTSLFSNKKASYHRSVETAQGHGQPRRAAYLLRKWLLASGLPLGRKKASASNTKCSALDRDCDPCDDWGRHFAAGDPYGNRTHIFAVRGRRLSRLTKGPCLMTPLLYHNSFQIATPFLNFFEKIFIFFMFFWKYALIMASNVQKRHYLRNRLLRRRGICGVFGLQKSDPCAKGCRKDGLTSVEECSILI